MFEAEGFQVPDQLRPCLKKGKQPNIVAHVFNPTVAGRELLNFESQPGLLHRDLEESELHIETLFQ